MKNKLVDHAQGKPYVIHTPYLMDDHFKQISNRYSKKINTALTDGEYGSTDYRDEQYIGMMSQGSRSIVVDLKNPTPIQELSFHALHNKAAGIFFPKETTVYASTDRTHWVKIGDTQLRVPPTLKEVIDLRIRIPLKGNIARYVKIDFQITGSSMFLDEIEIWGPDDAEKGAGLAHAGQLHSRSQEPLQWNLRRYFPSPVWFENQVLIFTGYKQDALTQAHKKEDYKPYVAYVDTKGKRVDWMFDSFLFLPYADLWDRSTFHAGSGRPTQKRHWQYYLSKIFDPHYELPALNEAVHEAKVELMNESFQAKVVIGIPFPPTDQAFFGDVDGDGVSENLHVEQVGERASLQNRKKVVKWFIEEARKSWNEHQFQHLKLIGFYWYNESLAEQSSVLDPELIRWTSDYLHEQGFMFEWIPSYFANGWNDWRELGFDVAILQPNYLFDPKAQEKRMDITVQAARDYGMGLEVEMEYAVLHDDRWRDRYYVYLNKYKDYGYMNRSYQVFYQGAKTLLQAAYSPVPEVREVYDHSYRYLKGKYGEK